MTELGITRLCYEGGDIDTRVAIDLVKTRMCRMYYERGLTDKRVVHNLGILRMCYEGGDIDRRVVKELVIIVLRMRFY